MPPRVSHIDRSVAGLLWVAFCSVLGLSQVAHAQMRLSPPISVLETRRGATARFEVGVLNRGKEPRECAMRASDMLLSPEGRAQAVEKSERGCGNWISFDVESFTLAPGEGRDVTCQLKVPRGASVGGHYAMVSVLAGPAASADESRTGAIITFGSRLDAAVLVTVLGGRLWGKIEPGEAELSAGEDLAGTRGRAEWAVEIPVKNTGNVHAMVTGEMSLVSEHGQRIARAPLEAGLGWILADGERVFRAMGTERLPDGVYLVRGHFNAGRRRVGAAVQTFTVHEGKAMPGEPTGALRAAIEAARPLYMMQASTLHFNLPPGGRRSQTIRVMNLTDRETHLEPRLIAYGEDEDGKMIFPAQPAHGRFRPDLITARPAGITLPPRSTRNMTVLFAMPRDAEGEYYAALALAEPGNELTTDDYLLAERTVLVTAEAARTVKREAAVVKLDVREWAGGMHQLGVRVKNVGNARCAAMGHVDVLYKGETIERLSFGTNEVLLLPNSERYFTILWPRVLEPGPYRAIATLVYAEGKTASRELLFEMRE